jgi:hypothetical protein
MGTMGTGTLGSILPALALAGHSTTLKSMCMKAWTYKNMHFCSNNTTFSSDVPLERYFPTGM